MSVQMKKSELEPYNDSMLQYTHGNILLEGKRFLLTNADAQGKLRRDLIENLGKERTKGFLLRYGWECGVHDAKDKKIQHPDVSDYTLIKRGAELHQFEGMADVKVKIFEFNSKNHEFYLEVIWNESYEAEQHLKYFGETNEPICWTLLGYAGGYATALLGKDIYYKEVSCRGKGDEKCFAIGKTVEDWGDEILPELHYYSETKIAEELEVAYRQIQRQNDLLLQTTTLHEQLNQMVISGKDRETVIKKVGKLLNHPIILESVHFEVLDYWLPEYMEASVKEVSIGAYINESQELQAIVKQIKEEKVALDWERMDLYTHTIIPIMIGDELVGYLSTIHGKNDDSEFSRMVAGRTAGVIALDFSKEKIKLEIEHRLKGEVLDELLDPGKPLEPILKRALVMGYDFKTKHQPVIWEIDHALKSHFDEKEFFEIRHQLFEIINTVMSLNHGRVLIVERQESVLSIIFHDERVKMTKIIEEVNRILKDRLHNITVSICIGRTSSSIYELRDSFYEAKKTLQLLTTSGRKGEVFHIEEMRIFDLLYAGSTQEQLVSFSTSLIKDLIEFDQANKGALTWTLYLFLLNDGHLKKTAESLNLSVSGLKYRIQKIKEIVVFDWESSEERFNLLLSLKVLRTNGFIVNHPV